MGYQKYKIDICNTKYVFYTEDYGFVYPIGINIFPTAYCLLPIGYSLLAMAYWLFPIGYGTLPAIPAGVAGGGAATGPGRGTAATSRAAAGGRVASCAASGNAPQRDRTTGGTGT